MWQVERVKHRAFYSYQSLLLSALQECIYMYMFLINLLNQPSAFMALYQPDKNVEAVRCGCESGCLAVVTSMQALNDLWVNCFIRMSRHLLQGLVSLSSTFIAPPRLWPPLHRRDYGLQRPMHVWRWLHSTRNRSRTTGRCGGAAHAAPTAIDSPKTAWMETGWWLSRRGCRARSSCMAIC